MAKSKNVAPTKQITLSPGEDIVEMLNSLAKTQAYGSNAAEVAKNLMMMKLRELEDQGKIKFPPRSQLSWEQSEN
jgi:hypothetical protein